MWGRRVEVVFPPIFKIGNSKQNDTELCKFNLKIGGGRKGGVN